MCINTNEVYSIINKPFYFYNRRYKNNTTNLINQNEIKALISLLDDPDEFIYNEVKNKLMELGGESIPFLEEYWETHPMNVESQSRIEDLIQQIQFENTRAELEKWIEKDNPDLLRGALLINQFQYPDLDVKPILEGIEKLKRDIWLELNPNLTSFETIKVINKIIFEEYGFSGNKTNYHSPHSSFLSNVMETKRGNPLSISIIYLLVTQDIGLPIFGVNLPSHFVLCYLDEQMTNLHLTEMESEDVLIYINPFSKGTMFDKSEIDSFLSQLNLPQKEQFYSPCSNKDIIKRMVNNLVFSYEKMGYADKAEVMKEILGLLS
jgi:regulator of sirC expression with transglutaminase-like and TPR domain